ncbi:hypothetical protein IQ26_05278 [Mesorhizobium tianshanense]|uniref:Uncharacterized protein n=1 Tax=Mesorhizobium tianshanense TaxID=39844 RepID=A0A562N8H6_9HYPH|nr:hypothetical protein IQ26_05278 [Mesorhizobium tianshanense]
MSLAEATDKENCESNRFAALRLTESVGSYAGLVIIPSAQSTGSVIR